MSKTEDLEVVFPGELIENDLLKRANIKNKVKLGPGLRRSADDVLVTKAGILRVNLSTSTIWVDFLQKLYAPTTNESVVGVVTKKTGDYYKLDIQASDQALLHNLSFDSATKKNKPDINVGDIIFGKLVVVSPDMEPELFCVNGAGKKGPHRVLPNDGFLFRISIHLVRKILAKKSCPLLDLLGKKFSYESAIGMNGIIWIKGKNVKETIQISNLILKSETLTSEEISQLF